MAKAETLRTCMKDDGLCLRLPGVSLRRRGGHQPGEELEDLVEALRLVMDNVYSGIIVCNKDSKILYMNRFYADLLKADREQAIGKHIKEFFPESRLPEVLMSGEMEIGQKCSLRADIALLVNRIPIKRGSETIGVILQTIFKDYTEINELMARLNLLEREVKFYKRGLDSMLSATFTLDSIVGKNRRLLEAKRMAEKYAKTDAAVLIVGATGTGKELFAQAVHKASGRKAGPFVCVNCAAIPKDLLESELFGYETGAFTGARQRGKTGRIELAHKGTLFLDEIGDLPQGAQSKILRVLETKKIERLGGLRSVEVDFRLVAATNKDLGAGIAAGRFREDLYFRLAVVLVRVPALRDRREDVPELCRRFLAQRPGGNGEGRELSAAALRFLSGHDWPGNVRELRNLMERVSVLSDEREISEETVRRLLGAGERVLPDPGLLPEEYGGLKLLEAKERFERKYLVQKLRESEYTITKAAQAAGIYPSALHAKMKKFGIESGE